MDAAKSKALILIVDKEEKPQIVITDKNAVEAAELKVAKWHDAFQASVVQAAPDLLDIEIKGPTAGTNYDFIDRDDDRFNVWVKDIAKWQQIGTNGAPTYQHNTVKISTTNVAGWFSVYNDVATSVDLVRYTGGSKGDGWFWSDSQMLVSNYVDDNYEAPAYLREDESAPAGAGLPKHGFTWEVSDRTHRIALGGTTKAEYEYLPGKMVQTEKTTNVVKIKVHVMILRETVGGAQVISLAAATMAIRRASEQYAQVGIQLVPNFQIVDPPVDPLLDLRDGFTEFSSQPGGGQPGGIITMTPEEKALLGAANLRTAATDDIELYFVNYMVDSRGTAYRKSAISDQKYVDSVIISARDATVFTHAHEIGHVLLDSGHYTAAGWAANLMRGGTTKTDTETASKRLTKGQGKDAHSKRPPLLPPVLPPP